MKHAFFFGALLLALSCAKNPKIVRKQVLVFLFFYFSLYLCLLASSPFTYPDAHHLTHQLQTNKPHMNACHTTHTHTHTCAHDVDYLPLAAKKRKGRFETSLISGGVWWCGNFTHSPANEPPKLGSTLSGLKILDTSPAREGEEEEKKKNRADRPNSGVIISGTLVHRQGYMIFRLVSVSVLLLLLLLLLLLSRKHPRFSI